MIEERDGSDTLVRFHVNGALDASALGASSIDERVATFTEGTGDRADGEFTYYLANQNFSIAGTDGTVIERLDYSSGGDFAGGGGGVPVPGEYFFDADEDGDIDLTDYAFLAACLLGPGVDPGTQCDVHDWEGDYDVDLLDFAVFGACFSGDGLSPPSGCRLDAAPPRGSPADFCEHDHFFA